MLTFLPLIQATAPSSGNLLLPVPNDTFTAMPAMSRPMAHEHLSGVTDAERDLIAFVREAALTSATARTGSH